MNFMRKNVESVKLIYAHKSSLGITKETDDLFGDDSYFVIHFFSKYGQILPEIISEISKDYPSISSEYPIGPFADLGEIKSFSLKIAKIVGAKEVCLLSVYDYNNGLEMVNHLNEFGDVFKSNGERIVLIEDKIKSQGIMERLFS